jgi:hypothetical protein
VKPTTQPPVQTKKPAPKSKRARKRRP